MIERTVFLHQDNDMLDILEGAGPVVGGNGERFRDAAIEGAGQSGGADREPLSAFTLHEPRLALPGFPNLPRTSVSGCGIVTPVWNPGLRKKTGVVEAGWENLGCGNYTGGGYSCP